MRFNLKERTWQTLCCVFMLRKMTNASNFNLLPPGFHVEESGNSVGTMENENDVKPDATELYRASLSYSEYWTTAQNNFGNVTNQFQFQNKQDHVAPTYGPPFYMDTSAVRKEPDLQLHNAVPSLDIGHGKKSISGPGYVHSEGTPFTQTPHPYMVMKYSVLDESDARQGLGFEVDTLKAKHVYKQNPSHIDSELIASTSKTSSKTAQDNLSSEIRTDLKSKFLMEKKTCPVNVTGVVDQLNSGCSELENGIAGNYHKYHTIYILLFISILHF